MSSFLNQTTFCPACSGSGYTNIEDNKNRGKCTECQGNGVFVKQSDALLYFGSAAYFDFAKREKIKSRRVVYFVIFGTIILGVIILLIYLYGLGNNFVKNTNLKPF
jgi:hypothetical protein